VDEIFVAQTTRYSYSHFGGLYKQQYFWPH